MADFMIQIKKSEKKSNCQSDVTESIPKGAQLTHEVNKVSCKVLNEYFYFYIVTF